MRAALVALLRNKMRSVLGKIRKGDLVGNRSRAAEVLKTLPTLED